MADNDDFGIDDDLDSPSQGRGGSRGGFAQQAAPRRPLAIVVTLAVSVAIIGGVLYGIREFGGKKEDGLKSSVFRSEKSAEAPVENKKIKYIKLYSQLDGTVASKVMKELSFSGVRFTVEQSGNNFTILVDKDQESMARNLLAVKGLPSGQAKGYELLDESQTLGVTEFDKRVRFLRALSGELEKAIMQFEMIEDAKVQIVLPEQRLFSVTQPPVTSSILIRKAPGSDLTDDIVFSIIMLVSKAVENLQPENVSVIDTQGHVLSEGIFERMASKKPGAQTVAGAITSSNPSLVAQNVDQAIGQPVVPNFDKLKAWFDLKEEYEQRLVKRAIKQLMGVLPIGSYKVAVDAELGAIKDGSVLDVKRLTISIVVDSNNTDIFLDQTTKQNIFSAVSGAVGYVKGRDAIELSSADFTLLSPEERQELERMKTQELLKRNAMRYVLIATPIVIALIILFFIFKYFSNRNKANMLIQKKEEEDLDGDSRFKDIQKEMAVERDIESYVSRVRAFAMAEPSLVASLMESWLLSDGPLYSGGAQTQVQNPDMTHDDFEDLGFEDEFFEDAVSEEGGS